MSQAHTQDRRTSDGPLAGEHQNVPRSVPPCGYWDNVGNWLCMLEAWEENSERRTLLSLLSTAQRNSFRLLHEWWNNDRQDQGLIYREWIVTPDPGTSTTPHNPPHLPWLEAPRRPEPSMHGSEYNRMLFTLWWKEFAGYHPDDYNPSTPSTRRSVAVLLRLRRNSAAIAAAHRVADLSYKRLTRTWRNESDSITENITQHPLAEKIPACIEPCPWLEPGQGSDNLPFYLWDRQRNCTVSIAEFEERAPYIVISHTWGRWILPGIGAFVRGVPWLVPQNSLFSVESLPDILFRVPGSSRYIWFDLVCIPQDDSLRKQIEIAKQAKIFAAAESSAVWFNTVTSWNGLQATMDWLSLEYLKVNNGGGYQVAGILTRAAKAAATSTGLVALCKKDGGEDQIKFPSRKSRRRQLEPIGWFTSLWTLQEACIRPDMWLCDKSWNILRVDETLPISLDYMVALFNASFPLWDMDRLKCPNGPHELAGIFTNTGLHKLLDMSPVDALLFGNQRYCKERRAEAIMSVIGSTTWYTARIEAASSQGSVNSGFSDVLLEGKYPLDFVEESRQKLGALFFSAVNITRFSKKMYHVDSQNRISDTRIRATMMPFSSFSKSQRLSIVDHHLATVDHPAVQSWEVRGDGSVKIRRAGVLASWPSRNPSNIKVIIKATPAGFSFSGEHKLDDWLQSFRPNAEKHAICLLRNFEPMCYGILIERIYLEPERKTFLKVGDFWFYYELTLGQSGGSYPFPEPKDVDWDVI
jgi:hypothetical protein